jgi:hypothetical protein
LKKRNENDVYGETLDHMWIIIIIIIIINSCLDNEGVYFSVLSIFLNSG